MLSAIAATQRNAEAFNHISQASAWFVFQLRFSFTGCDGSPNLRAIPYKL